MEETSRSEGPILSGLMRQGEAARSRHFYYMLVLSCAGGAMEVTENVSDGEGYEARRRQHHAYDPRSPGRCAGMLFDIMRHVFFEGEQLQSAFKVYERKWSFFRALKLKVAVVQKNLQNAELGMHLLRSAATLDSFTCNKNEVINNSLEEAAVR